MSALKATVLIADDDPFNLRLLQELCESAGHTVLTALDGREALDAIARRQPDLVLLEAELPGIDGLEVLRVLKGDPDLAEIPVLVVTAAEAEDARHRAIELGAVDYLARPYRMVEVHQRIRTALRLRAAETAAREARDAVARDSLVDALTHAGTAHQLSISMEYELTRAQRYGHPLTCVVVRVENAAAIAGAAGDDAVEGVLVALSGGLRGCIRAIDHLFRSGDGEFTMILPETAAAGAGTVVERVRARAADQSLWGVAVTPAPVLRIASACYPDDSPDSGEALRHIAASRL
jgi:diguanylate cyclase (GGDEF)-like protein